VEYQDGVGEDSAAAHRNHRIAQQQALAACEREYAEATKCVVGVAPASVFEPFDEGDRNYLAHVERERGPESARFARHRLRDREVRRRLAFLESSLAATRPRRASGPLNRQRRARSARPASRRRAQTRAGDSRGSPSDDAEGDGEGPPSPALARAEPRRRRSEPSSSQQGEGFFGAWSVVNHGIDTVSYAFRPAGRFALDAWADVPSQRLSRRERGKSLWATHAVGGIKLGVFPAHGLFLTEGRLAPMLSGDSGDMRLAAPETLTLGADRARDAFRSLGVDVGDEPVVRRLDLAGEIRFTHPSDGLLFLRTFGGLQLAGLHQQRTSSRQQTGSVSWSPGRGIALRLYDAGAYHGTDHPGITLRLERQLRPPKPQQVSPEAFTTESLAQLYLGPLAKVIGAGPSMNVLPPRAAERLLIERVQSHETSLAIAERLIGVARIMELGADALLYDPATASGRHRQLGKNGVIFDPSADEGGSTIDVCAVLAALSDRWRATARQTA
jgi:hypothetical protein